MIPAGYQAVFTRSKRHTPGLVVESYGINSHISEEFLIWHSQRNGHEFYDSQKLIEEIAIEDEIALEGAKLFYYELYDFEYAKNEDEEWEWFEIDPSNIRDYEGQTPNIVLPEKKKFEGYDIVSFVYNLGGTLFSWQNYDIEVNKHGLVDSLEECKQLIESKRAHLCCREPGSLRIYGIYSVPWKHDPVRALNECAPYVEIRSDTLSLRDLGATYVDHILSLEEIEILRNELALQNNGSNILETSPSIRQIATSARLMEAVSDLLESKPRLLRATTNYTVVPQDKTDEVKDTIVLCVYLDDGTLENGAIKLLPELKKRYCKIGRIVGFRPSFFHSIVRDTSIEECRVLFLEYRKEP